MGDKMDIAKKKCITPEFRLSFPKLAKAESYEDGPPKFGLVQLYDKSIDIKALKIAALNAVIEKYGPDYKTKIPKTFRWPWRDGDEKQDTEGYAGCYFVSASSAKKPGLLRAIGKTEKVAVAQDEIEEIFYPGCYCRATLIAFTYDKKGNKGVSFALQNVLKTRDGESLSGRRSAEQDFGEIEVENYNEGADDPSNYEADDMGLPM